MRIAIWNLYEEKRPYFSDSMSVFFMEDQGPQYKTGLVYLSRIPPHMNSHKLRYILNQYGLIDRLYLRKEPLWKYKKRIEKGGRKGRLYTDGWAEFKLKSEAKFCEQQLNGKTAQVRGRWQNDIWCVKYLHGFKWKHLEEALEKERKEHLTKFKEEDEKARQTAKNWLKQAKTTVYTKKSSAKPKFQDDEDGDEDDGSDSPEEDDLDEDHVFTCD